MLRDNLFKSSANAGEDIRNIDNEQGFIITPLLNASPIREPKLLKDVAKIPTAIPDLESSALNSPYKHTF